LGIFLSSIFGSASIGVYSLVTDQVAIVPPQAPEGIAKRFEEWLKVKVVRTTIGESVLAGVLARANSKGIILPHCAREEEIKVIKSAVDLEVGVMETKRTAYGNLILANDRGAVADLRLNKRDILKIEETLGVEAVPAEIAGLPYVGSLATATNRGILAHPLLKEEERKLLMETLKVPVDVGTVNCGIPYVATGLVGNAHGSVTGFMTTGPELFIIGQALDVVKEYE